MLEIFSDLFKILLPSGILLYGMYLTVSAFLRRQMESKVLELRNSNTQITLPIRMQAYERLVLFLERITPNNLILRLNSPEFNSREFQQVLMSNIREEYNHNMVQQIYVTDRSWALLKTAMEDIIGIINAAAQRVDPAAPAIVLAKEIFEILLQREQDPVAKAIRSLKDELKEVF